MFNIKRIAMALGIVALVGLTGALTVGLVSAWDMTESYVLSGSDPFTVASEPVP